MEIRASEPLAANDVRTVDVAAVRRIRHPLKARRLEVLRVRRLAPRMVRVTLGGAELAGFRSLSPDDHVKLFFPPDGEDEPVLPEVRHDAVVAPPAGAVRPVSRDYTVRHLRAESGELDIDVAVHGEGPGSGWAASARPGQRVGMLGPRGSLLRAMDADWYLLGADETGLPALAGWLERIPERVPVHAVIEVHDRREQIDLPCPGDLTLVWLHRADGDTLEAGVRRFVPPGGAGYVWIAGEATALRAIRRHVRGYRQARVDVDGYWRRGVADHDHHAVDPADTEPGDHGHDETSHE